jgi:uncharacterized delta-60 repeat protein
MNLGGRAAGNIGDNFVKKMRNQLASLMMICRVRPARWLRLAGAAAFLLAAGLAAAQPTNDNFANATILSANYGSTNGDNTLATLEPCETNAVYDPEYNVENITNTVWYAWTAPANGTLEADTAGSGSGLDFLLSVWTSTNAPGVVTMCDGSLTNIISDDDGQVDGLGNAYSEVNLPVVAGTTYYLAVESWDDGSAPNDNAGPYVLNWDAKIATIPTGGFQFSTANYVYSERESSSPVAQDGATVNKSVLGARITVTRPSPGYGRALVDYTVVLPTATNVQNIVFTTNTITTNTFVYYNGVRYPDPNNGNVATNTSGKTYDYITTTVLTNSVTNALNLTQVLLPPVTNTTDYNIVFSTTNTFSEMTIITYSATNGSFSVTNLGNPSLVSYTVNLTNAIVLNNSGLTAGTNTIVFDNQVLNEDVILPVTQNVGLIGKTQLPAVAPYLILSNPRLDSQEPSTLIPPTLGTITQTVVTVESTRYPSAGLDALNLERATFRVDKDVNGGNAVISVLRSTSPNLAQSVSIDYTTDPTGTIGYNPADTFPLQAGSDYATPNTDFTPVSGTVSWGANVTTPQTISIPILDNGQVEFNMDISVRIYFADPSAHTYETVGQVNRANVTILFNDTDGGQQPAGAVDRTWNQNGVSDSNPPFQASPGTAGGGGTVYAVAEQPNGDAIVAGSFTTFDQQQYNRIVRLLPNGFQDPAFQGDFSPWYNSACFGPNDFIAALALQPADGKIIIGGNFTAYNGNNRHYIARLNTDGSLDATFNPGTGADGIVWAVALAPSGQVYIAGAFTNYNGNMVKGVARLNADGSLDTTFNPGIGPDGVVNAIALDASGRVLIGGAFENVAGVSSGAVARLNVDGSLDTTFSPGIGTFNPDTFATDTIHSLAVQTDGRILIGGSFSYYNLVNYNGLARLNTDGTLDLTFSPGTGTLNPITGDSDTIYAMLLQTNGEILIAGNLTTFNQTRREGLALLFTDGSVDTSFMDGAYNALAGVPNAYFNPDAVGTNYTYLNPLNYNTRNAIYALAEESGGNVIIGGTFDRVGGGYTRDDIRPRSNVARLVGGSTPGPGNIEFLYNQYSVNNSAGSLYVSLIRTNGNLGIASATFSTNTATAGPGVATGADFGLSTNYDDPTWGTAWTAAAWLYEVSVYGPNFQTTPLITRAADVYVTVTNSGNISGNLSADFSLSNPSGATFKLGGEFIELDAALGARASAPLTIIDVNALPGVLGYSALAYSVVENGSNATITVTRTNGTGVAVQVGYATSNGTATNGVDYTGSTNFLSFAVGLSSASFTIPTKSKYTSVQPDKTVNLSLFGATGGATIGQTNAVLTLINPNGNSYGHLEFAQANFVTNENSGVLYVTVNRAGSSSGTLGVTVVTTDGTAINGVNYLGSTNVLTWNSGNASPQTIAIPVLDDHVVTANLTAGIYLTNSTVNGTNNSTLLAFGGTNATLTINNVDSAGAVQFSTAAYSVNKNGGYALIPVVRLGGSVGSITNTFTTLDNTAVNGIDYQTNSGTMIFTNGQVSQYFTVPIINNSNTKATPLNLTLQLGGSNLGSPATATLTIINTLNVEESPGSSDITFDSSAGFNNNVYALALQSNNQILAGGDFTLADGVTRYHIARLNADGSIDAGFSLPSSAMGANASVRAIAVQTDGRILIGGLFTNVNSVVLNHVARLNYDGTLDSLFQPGSGADNTVYAIAQSPVNGEVLIGGAFATVSGNTFNGIAELTASGPPDPTFNAGGLGANATVYALAVQPDGRIIIGGDFTTYNGVTNFNHIARLNVDGSVDTAFNPGAGASGSVRAIAVQLDGKIVIGGLFTNVNGVAFNRIARLNADGSVDTSFNPGVGASDAVLALAIQSNNRIVVGGSFTTASGVTRNRITRLNPDGSVDPTINFGTGANNFVAALAIQEDTINGYPTNVPDEKIILAGGFTQYDGAPHAYIARIYGGSISGSGAFQFSAASYGVDEDGTNVTITVIRTGGTSNAPSGDVFITANATDGSAVGGVNYSNLSPYVLDFPLGEVLKTFKIPVMDDGVVTTNLTVNLALANPTAPAEIGDQPIATLYITNDDSTISFSSATYSVSKNVVSGVAPITVSRNGGINGSASVFFTTTTNGTATIGLDYAPTNAVLTFAPGVSNVTVSIPINNNGIPEGNQTVGLQLSNPAGSSLTPPVLATPTNATLTIIDTVNAPGQLSFIATNYIVTEGGGVGYSAASVTVQRTYGSYGTVSVGFNTQDGTAVSGLKYLSTNGVLNFADGETSKSFVVQAVNTATAEGPEYLNVNLFNPTGGASLATPTNATVTILNTNVGLAFALGTNSFTEPSGTVNGSVVLNVIRLNNTNGTTTVYYSTTNGTAVAGTNFIGVTNALLTFNPGDSVKPITLTTIHDPLVTGDLFFSVGLFNPSLGAQLTAPSVTTVIDHDADAGISFLTAAQSVYRNAGSAIIEVISSNPNVGPVSVNYATGGGTAVAGTDYTATSGTLTLTNGQSLGYFTVPLLINNSVQSNRTFNVTLSAPTAPGQLLVPSVETVTIIGTNTPPGLSFETPLVINGTWGATNVNNTGGAPEIGDPNIAGFSPVAPVWVQWTAPADGEVTVDTIGSVSTNGVKLDTVLAVFTGTSLGNLNQVAANDDLYPNFPQTQFNYTGQNIFNTNAVVSTNGYSSFYFTNVPPYIVLIPNVITNQGGIFQPVSSQYAEPFSGPSGLRFNAKAGTTYYFAADTKASEVYNPQTAQFTITGTGAIQINWAYHSSGAFRFASEDVDQTGITDTNGNPILLYHCAETEGDISSRGGFVHGVVGPVVTDEYRTTTDTYYTHDVYGLLVTVTRVAGSSGRALVDYTTADGYTNMLTQGDVPALSNVDYTPISGTLVFDDYEMSKTLVVPIIDDGGISRPNRDFTVVLSNPRRDTNETTSVSFPRVDNIFGQALCRILDCDIDPRGPSRTQLITSNTVVVLGVTNTLFSTNVTVNLQPTNGVFNFSKASYCVPRDEQSFFPNTPVTVYVNRMGTNRASATVYYRFDNYFLTKNGADDRNIYFPLQAGSDYATPTPATTAGVLGTNSDFISADGSLTFPGGNNNPFQSQPIHFNIQNNQVNTFNKDVRIGIYEEDANGNPVQAGMVAETTVTILFDDTVPPAGSVDELYNPDFAVDLAFVTNSLTLGTSVVNPGTDPFSEVYALALTPANQTIIGGSFSTYADGNNSAHIVNGLARLNTDGSLDTTFNSGIGINVQNGEFIRSLAVTPANEVFIGGDFSSYKGTQRNSIALVAANGSLDTSFNPGSGFNGTVWSVLLQSDGSILAGGDFTAYNGTPCSYVARLLPSGALDTTFNASNVLTGPVYSMAQAAANLFNLTRSSSSTNEDDQAINLGTLTAGTLTVNYNMANNPNDMRIFYGNTNIAAGTGVLVYDTGNVTGPGSIVLPFAPVGGFTTNLLTIVMNQGGSTNISTSWNYTASVSIPQSSQGIMVGGQFNVAGQHYSNIARLNTDGSLDTTFNPGSGADGAVMSLAWQLNSQIVAGGNFLTVNGTAASHIARFNVDGSLDNAFYSGTGLDGVLYSILPQLDGTLYLGGSFTTYNGTHRLGFARIYPNGTLDTTFLDTAYNQFAGLPRILFSDAPGTVYSSAVQGDGNVMIGGAFQEVGGGQADYNVRDTLDEERGLLPSFADPNLWVAEGGSALEPKSRDGVRNRSNVARLIGGVTPGPGNIGMVSPSYAVNKTQLTEPITLVRTNGALGYASANFAVLPGLAQSGADYSYSSVAPLYPIDWEYNDPSRMHSDGWFGSAGIMQSTYGSLLKYGFNGPASVNITIINDSQTTGNLSAGLQMANPADADQFYLGGQNIPLGVALGESYAPLTIVDNGHQDGTFGFSSPTYTATNSTAVVNVVRTNSTIGTVTVSYQTTTNGSTAVLGTDYSAASGSLIFSPGQSLNNFTVNILENSYISTAEKTVNLLLNNIQDSSGGNAFLGLSNAVLRIINPNYQGFLNLTTNYYTANLSAQAIAFTVTRSVGSKGTLTVQYATTNGTAINGVDYLGTTNTLTWNSGDVSPRTVSIPLVTNSVVGAPNKQFGLALFNPTLNGTNSPLVLGGVTNAVMNIVDDNSNGTFQFSRASYLVNENGGYATITVTRSGSGLGAATVNFATTNVTAFAGTNYVATNGVLHFAQGQLTSSFTVPILNDGKTNPPPSAFFFTVNLFTPSAGAVLGSPVTSPVNIVDVQSYNQPPGSLDPSFTGSMNNSVLALALESDGQIVAGGGFSLVDGASRSHVARLNLDGSLDTAFLNGLAGADGSINALISQTDDRIVIGGAFANVNSTVRNRIARLMTDGTLDSSFSPGSGADNSVFALAETFINGARELYVGGAFSTFNGTSYPGIVRLFNSGAVDATFATGIGANGAVYALAAYPTNSIYNAGQVLAGGSFTNFNNTVVANLVRLNSDGSVDTNFAAKVSVNAAVRAIALQLDGGILIGGDFTNINNVAVNHLARLNADGSLDLAFVTNSAGGINGTVSTIVLQADNRIIVGGQFTRANGVTRSGLTRLLSTGVVDPTINFGAGANGAVNAAVVQPADGMIVIGGAFTQFNGQAADYIARLYGNSATGSGTFQFSSASFQIAEDAGFAIITVARTGGTSGTNADGSGLVYVNFATTNGGSAVAGVNYLPVSTNLAFPAGEVFEQIFVPVINNLFTTSNLTVNLALDNPGAPASLGDQSTAVLTIINVNSTLSFLSANYTIPKNTVNGVATIDIVRQGSTSGTSTVNFSTTTNGSAVIGTDYYPTNATVTFNPGDTDKTVQIPIINNNIPEGSRTVGLQLTNVLGSLLTSPSNATLTINDTVFALGQLQLSATNYVVNSTDGFANLTVLRTNGFSDNINVNYVLVPGSAAPGSNYINSPVTVSIPDGQTSESFQIPLINNPLVFQTTTFSVYLVNPTTGVALTAPTNATVTIVSGNSGLAFQSATNYVSETNSVGLVFVQRFGNTNNTITVNYATTNNGTAVAGYNYAPSTGTMTFNPGETVAAISVPLYNRSLTTNVSFGINLSGPSAGTTVVQPSSALVYIQGSKAGLSFTTNAVSVLKSGTNLLITVVCSNPSAEPVVLNTNTIPLSVSYYTTNLTAVAGTDYVPVSGTLVFTNGIATNTIVVPIIGNNLLEGNRTFNVVLAQPTATGVLMAPTNEVVTIVDINCGVQFSSPTYAVLKSNVVANITVFRTGYTNTTVSVNYATTNGTAVANQNYLPASGTLVFTNGQTSQNFGVTILDNTAIQQDLTVLLQLSSPTNAALIYPSFSTLTIHDVSGSLVVPSGAVLVKEGFSPANGIIDPGETNTVAFGFRASAGLNVTNLIATLVATNGVTFTNGAASASASYGLLTVGGAAKFQPYTFVANGTNAQNIVANFNLSNGSSNLGTAIFTFTLGTWKTVVSNTATIIINPNGVASPYPSYINISGLNGVVTKATVTLTNLSHYEPGQMSALVVAPNQSDTLIMSHAGAGNQITKVTLTFDDAAATNLTQNGQIVTGTNKPTQWPSPVTFP